MTQKPTAPGPHRHPALYISVPTPWRWTAVGVVAVSGPASPAAPAAAELRFCAGCSGGLCDFFTPRCRIISMSFCSMAPIRPSTSLLNSSRPCSCAGWHEAGWGRAGGEVAGGQCIFPRQHSCWASMVDATPPRAHTPCTGTSLYTPTYHLCSTAHLGRPVLHAGAHRRPGLEQLPQHLLQV